MEISSKGIKAVLIRDDIRFMLKAFRRLPEKERLILYHRFGLDYEKCYTLEEISKLLKLSRERVRQLQVKALNKLRQEFNNIDVEYQMKLENERQSQEKLRREQERQQQELRRKEEELEIRKEIRKKVRQWHPSKIKSRRRTRWDAIANTEHYKFISSFDYSDRCIKRLERLIDSGESMEERIRSAVAEIYPELDIKSVSWCVAGKFLIVSYQPTGKRKYTRIDIYLPYFLASKENRARLIRELQQTVDIVVPSSVEELLSVLKLRS